MGHGPSAVLTSCGQNSLYSASSGSHAGGKRWSLSQSPFQRLQIIPKSKSFLKSFVSVMRYLYRIQFTYSFVVKLALSKYIWDGKGIETQRNKGNACITITTAITFPKTFITVSSICII